MEYFIKIITDLGSTVSGIAAIIMLIVAYKSGLLGFLTGSKDKNSYKGLTERMEQLQQHYNHDTTALLQEISANQKDIMNKIEIIIQKNNEILTYGVKTRK